MALNTNQLFRQDLPIAAPPRIVPREDGVLPKPYAAGTALLPVGTPLAMNSSTGFWVPFTQGGSNDTDTIRGFVYPDPVQLVSGNEVLGQTLVRGSVHRDDVNTTAIRAVLGGSASEANVDARLRAGKAAVFTVGSPDTFVEGTPSLRQLGIDVLGLTGVK